GVRDQPHRERIAVHFRNRERDAVDRDAALVDQILPAAGRSLHPQITVRPTRLENLDDTQAVHVAGDEVTAHLAAEAEAALEVDRRARRDRRDTRQPARLLEEVKLHAVRVELYHGEATAVHRDAVAERDINQRRLRR